MLLHRFPHFDHLTRKCAQIAGILLLSAAICAPALPVESLAVKEPVYEETLVVDVFDSLANYQGIQSGWFAKLVKDRFNIELNIIAPNVAGGGDTLYQTRAAAGSLGDLIISNGSNNNLKDLVTAGLVMDISGYLKGKDIMRYEDAIRHYNDPVSPTAIYAIPSEISVQSGLTPSENTEPTYGPYLRYDLYTAVGAPKMNTLEDLLPVLQQMQSLCPEAPNGHPTYGFSLFKDWDGNMMMAAKQPACFYGYEEYGFVLYQVDGCEYQDILAEDSIYQRILKLYFDANQMGLVDPDSPNQNYADVYHKCSAGEILFSPWPWLGKSAYNTMENRNLGKGFMFVPIEDMSVLLNGCYPLGKGNTIIAVGANAKDPGRIAAFIDWLYSPEGVYANSSQPITGTAGPEGLTWQMTENGPSLTDFGIQAHSGEDPAMPEEAGGGTWNGGRSKLNINTVSLIDPAPNGYPYYYTLWPSFRKQDHSVLDALWQEDMQASDSMDYLLQHGKYTICPGYTYQAEAETPEIATLRNQCKNLIISYSWQMVFAPDEETFYHLQQELQTAVRSLGYEQVLQKDMENARLQTALRKESVTAKAPTSSKKENTHENQQE